MMIAAVQGLARQRFPIEPNHRQQIALARIEFAVGELSTTLLSHCPTRDIAMEAIDNIRHAVSAAVADVLAVE